MAPYLLDGMHEQGGSTGFVANDPEVTRIRSWVVPISFIGTAVVTTSGAPSVE